MDINDDQSCEITSKKKLYYFYYLQNIVSSINIPDMSIFPDTSSKLFYKIISPNFNFSEFLY